MVCETAVIESWAGATETASPSPPEPAETKRTTLLPESTIMRSPGAVGAASVGSFSSAAVGGPPFPLEPAVPLPATVTIMPVARLTSRTALLPPSAMKRFPASRGRRSAEHGARRLLPRRRRRCSPPCRCPRWCRCCPSRQQPLGPGYSRYRRCTRCRPSQSPCPRGY